MGDALTARFQRTFHRVALTENAMNATRNYFQIPTHCPHCDTALTRNGEHLVCPNDLDCPAQVSGLIKVWVKKIGLKGVGREIIDFLCDEGILSDPADLYGLDEGELAEMLMNGRRIGGTAKNVVTEIKSKMDLPLHVVLGSLNIPLCSRSTFKTVVDAGYDTLDKIRTASVGQLASIDGMGSGRANNMVGGIKKMETVIDRLLAAGITIQAPADGVMKGKTVCLTGFRDSDMDAAIEAAGGTIKSSVGKTLAILVARDPKSTSGKAKKARGYGVEIIGPDEMWDRLGGRP